MATIGEANAINRLLRWITGSRNAVGALTTDITARDTAMMLADRAHKVLGGGLHADEVAEQWPTIGLSVPVLLAEVKRQRQALAEIAKAYSAFADGEMLAQDALQLIGKQVFAEEVEP